MSQTPDYARLPVPALWSDVFQKFKANGINTVSIYFFWSYHSASRGTYDFTSPAKDLQRLLSAAQEAGLYVIARPGPYCNAETNAGGFALWTSDGSGGKYRTSDATYRETWSEWVAQVGSIIAKNQITNGGPVILTQVENELQETRYVANDTLVLYMEQLKTAFKEAGIVVPLTHNEKGFRSKSWSSDYKNVGGAIDVYGLDSYPGGMSCTNLDTGFNLPRTYYQWFQEVSPSQPEYLPEFEGGWFQPWGGYFFDQCKAEQSPEFADVFYKGLIGQRATLLNLYMVCFLSISLRRVIEMGGKMALAATNNSYRPMAVRIGVNSLHLSSTLLTITMRLSARLARFAQNSRSTNFLLSSPV